MASGKYNEKEILGKLRNLFREHGYHGTTYAHIQEASGLGKGSLYHHFSDGKEGIGRAVLSDVHRWFEEYIYQVLEKSTTRAESRSAVENMFQKTLEFFEKGERVCVPGSFALYDARDSFEREIRLYFDRWIRTLAGALQKAGLEKKRSENLSIDTIASIQGGLVLARAMKSSAFFRRVVEFRKKDLMEIL